MPLDPFVTLSWRSQWLLPSEGWPRQARFFRSELQPQRQPVDRQRSRCLFHYDWEQTVLQRLDLRTTASAVWCARQRASRLIPSVAMRGERSRCTVYVGLLPRVERNHQSLLCTSLHCWRGSTKASNDSTVGGGQKPLLPERHPQNRSASAVIRSRRQRRGSSLNQALPAGCALPRWVWLCSAYDVDEVVVAVFGQRQLSQSPAGITPGKPLKVRAANLPQLSRPGSQPSAAGWDEQSVEGVLPM